MATMSWVGGAVPVRQVQTFAFGGTWEATDLIRVTIGQKIVDFVAGSTTIATLVSSLATAWNALSATVYPEFAEITASANTTTLTLTADTAGKPFTVTLTPLEANGSAADAQEIEGAGVATTGTTATANAGPNDWSTAANWSGGAVPANGDTVTIDRIGTKIYWGLAQSGVTLASLQVLMAADPDFILGLPRDNRDSTTYPEYRPTYLAIGATACKIDVTGGRTKVAFGTVQTTTLIENSGAAIEENVPAVLITGTHASNAFTVMKGDVGFGFFGESTTLATLQIGQRTSATDSKVACGTGCTLGTITQASGSLEVNSAIGTSLTKLGGQKTVIEGTGAVAQITARGGDQIVYNTSGTLGGNTVLAGGVVLNFDQDLRAKTVTNPIDCYDSADVQDTNKVVATLVIDYNQTARLGLGSNIRVTRGAVA